MTKAGSLWVGKLIIVTDIIREIVQIFPVKIVARARLVLVLILFNYCAIKNKKVRPCRLIITS